MTEIPLEEARRLGLLDKPAKRSKYRNILTQTDAGVADSKVEAARWAELRLLEAAGAITDLRFHPRYTLAAGIVYEADSCYIENGQRVVEDVKGKTAKLTEGFRLKARLFEDQFGYEIRIERR